MKKSGERLQMFFSAKNFQTGYNRYINTIFSTLLHKFEINTVIKKHLSYHIICSGLYLLFESLNIPVNIWGFKMLLRITRNAYTKIRFLCIRDILQIITPIHILNLFYQFNGIFVCRAIRMHRNLSPGIVSSYGQYIMNTQIV